MNPRALKTGASVSIAVLLFLLLALSSAQGSLDLGLERIKRATVFVYQAETAGNSLIVTCISTGTLISADGLIITKANGVVPSQQCNGDNLIVSLNVDLAEPPIPKYRADIVTHDAGLDIALLRIARELDGRLVAQGELPVLPFVAVGNSDDVAIDDNLIVMGYPDIGNGPVAFSRGTVTAFLKEPLTGSRTWFKTRAEIPGTMAGGGAYNTAGELIGIPTNAPLAGSAAASNCRYLNDTNSDGLVNSSDRCVPTGDFISTIRPIALAQHLIRGARLGLNVDATLGAREAEPPRNPPLVSRLFVAPSVRGAMPSTVVGSLPSNTRNLYLFFDYDNFSAETAYELRVTRDGIPDTTFSLPPVRWSGGERGLWYIGAREQAWANGAYEFTLLVNGAGVGAQKIIIGGGAEDRAHFSDIVFGTLDQAGNLIGNGSIVPLGNIAFARFLHANMAAGRPWSAIWYYAGAEFARTSDAWSDDAFGSKVISVDPAGGLLPGEYRLELYLDGALSATSDFYVAGEQGSPLPRIFSNLRFTSADSLAEARNGSSASSYPSSIPALFALFDWQRITAGTPWTASWLVDDQEFFRYTQPWLAQESGTDFAFVLPDPPDGNYQLQLLVNDLLLLEQSAVVGIGQLPIDRFAEIQGTILTGSVIDAATQQGIPSLTIVLISENFDASEFVWNQEQVVALATTDRNGEFQFARPLAFDTPYSVVIEAEGYIPNFADVFDFDPNQTSVDITIEMVRG